MTLIPTRVFNRFRTYGAGRDEKLFVDDVKTRVQARIIKKS